MTSTDYRLTVGTDGKLTGNAVIEYNSPFPCVNGDYKGAASMQGVVMHTMVGNLPGTITVFNNPSYQASAFFGIDQSGKIHQFGPVGKNWRAWAQVAGNSSWYSIEHADNGDPDIPLTAAQILASAQLVECLSAFAGFPLQVTDSTTGKGYGTHEMGGAAWGGHTCPDLPPLHVRSAQRQAIIDLAKQIRAYQPVAAFKAVTMDGTTTLRQIARKFSASTGSVLAWTIKRVPWQAKLIGYMIKMNWDAPVPAGVVLMVRTFS